MSEPVSASRFGEVAIDVRDEMTRIGREKIVAAHLVGERKLRVSTIRSAAFAAKFRWRTRKIHRRFGGRVQLISVAFRSCRTGGAGGPNKVGWNDLL
jgi:hypothetical protein